MAEIFLSARNILFRSLLQTPAMQVRDDLNNVETFGRYTARLFMLAEDDPMRLSIFLMSLMLIGMLSSAAQEKSDGPSFVNKECGFQAALQQGWKMQPSSQPCAFRIAVGDHGEVIEVTIKQETAQQGANDLGFTNNGERWMLYGKEPAKAEAIEGATWTGLQGTTGIDEGKGSGSNPRKVETHALLFDRKGRLAEVQFKGPGELVSLFVDGFEFLAE